MPHRNLEQDLPVQATDDSLSGQIDVAERRVEDRLQIERVKQ
jgi:hypothetical protein